MVISLILSSSVAAALAAAETIVRVLVVVRLGVVGIENDKVFERILGFLAAAKNDLCGGMRAMRGVGRRVVVASKSFRNVFILCYPCNQATFSFL